MVHAILLPKSTTRGSPSRLSPDTTAVRGPINQPIHFPLFLICSISDLSWFMNALIERPYTYGDTEHRSTNDRGSVHRCMTQLITPTRMNRPSAGTFHYGTSLEPQWRFPAPLWVIPSGDVRLSRLTAPMDSLP